LVTAFPVALDGTWIAGALAPLAEEALFFTGF